jgi:hypothetical protein
VKQKFTLGLISPVYSDLRSPLLPDRTIPVFAKNNTIWYDILTTQGAEHVGPNLCAAHFAAGLLHLAPLYSDPAYGSSLFSSNV